MKFLLGIVLTDEKQSRKSMAGTNFGRTNHWATWTFISTVDSVWIYEKNRIKIHQTLLSILIGRKYFCGCLNRKQTAYIVIFDQLWYLVARGRSIFLAWTKWLTTSGYSKVTSRTGTTDVNNSFLKLFENSSKQYLENANLLLIGSQSRQSSGWSAACDKEGQKLIESTSGKNKSATRTGLEVNSLLVMQHVGFRKSHFNNMKFPKVHNSFKPSIMKRFSIVSSVAASTAV